MQPMPQPVRPLPARRATAAIAVVLAAACGGGSKGPTTPTPPATVATFTLGTTGVSPKSVQIVIGERVRFVNSDTQLHNMGSDPHPEHTDCPEINQVGFLLPGQSRETGNFVQPRTCGFHDHDNPTNQSLRGTIVIR
jgi:hypothetical protein